MAQLQQLTNLHGTMFLTVTPENNQIQLIFEPQDASSILGTRTCLEIDHYRMPCSLGTIHLTDLSVGLLAVLVIRALVWNG